MIRRYHVNGNRIKVENNVVSIEGHGSHLCRKPTPLEAAIYVVWNILGPHATVETRPWRPWEEWHHRTQARTVDDIRMWIRYRPAPFDSYIVKTRTHTIQIPTFPPYRTAQEDHAVYDIVAVRAAPILARMLQT